MRLPRDERFEWEARRWNLVYTCEWCAHWDRKTGRCAHAWPTEDHVRPSGEEGREEVVFCKEFQLD